MRHGQHHIPLPGMRAQCRQPASHSATAPTAAVSEARAGGGEDVEILGRGHGAFQHGWRLAMGACAQCWWRRCSRTAALHDRKVAIACR